MDINVDIVKEEIEFKESIVVVKTEDEYEDISKLNVKTERDLNVEENQDGNLPATFVKKEPDDDNIERLKEEFSSSEVDETLYKIKIEELMIKTENECDVSKTGAYREEDRQNHTITHTDEILENKTYSCYYCDYKSHRKWKLRIHIEGNHVEKKLSVKKYGCHHCEYKSNYKSHLNRHVVAIHDKIAIKKYDCNHCDYKSNNKGHLNRHFLTIHDKSAIKNYGCNHCDYKTHCKSDLNRHVLTRHDKMAIKKYSCDHCDFRTHYKLHLDNHYISHLAGTLKTRRIQHVKDILIRK